MSKNMDLTGERYGYLVVIKQIGSVDGKRTWLCKCDCGNEVVTKGVYLKSGETRSCGCFKKEIESKNLRTQYDDKRVNGVVMPLFKGKEPRQDSSTGYRGVAKYYTRKSRQLRYRAWITVKGKRYYKTGFKTAEEAYYKGRLFLEQEHLPMNKK